MFVYKCSCGYVFPIADGSRKSSCPACNRTYPNAVREIAEEFVSLMDQFGDCDFYRIPGDPPTIEEISSLPIKRV